LARQPAPTLGPAVDLGRVVAYRLLVTASIP